MKYGSAHHLSRVLIGLAALALGCATPVEVAFEGREDLSRYRTWSWAREDGPRVHAPQDAAAALEAQLNRYVEEQLSAKGFRRTRRGGDFIVSYRLAVARRSRVEQQAKAGYHVSSHSSPPSFMVEGTAPVVRNYQAIHVAIGASEPAGETLWRAELRQDAEDSFSLTLREAVAKLLERLPEPGPERACRAADETYSETEAEPGCTPPKPETPPRRRSYSPGQLG